MFEERKKRVIIDMYEVLKLINEHEEVKKGCAAYGKEGCSAAGFYSHVERKNKILLKKVVKGKLVFYFARRKKIGGNNGWN